MLTFERKRNTKPWKNKSYFAVFQWLHFTSYLQKKKCLKQVSPKNIMSCLIILGDFFHISIILFQVRRLAV